MMKKAFLFLFLSLCFSMCVLGEQDMINIDAFTYVPSPNGNRIAIFYYFHRPKNIDDDIRTPIGKCLLFNPESGRLDSIETSTYVDYTLDKDGISWINNTDFAFSKYCVQDGKANTCLFGGDDPYDVRTMHIVNQTSLSPTGKMRIFWLLQGSADYRRLVIDRNGQLDTILTLRGDDLNKNKSAVDFYRIFWTENEKILIFGANKKGANLLYRFKVDTSNGLQILDTIDNCFYRTYEDMVYYPKNSAIHQRNIITERNEMAIADVTGEFDIGKQGIIFCRNSRIYLQKSKDSKPILLCENGFAPRWLGNKSAIIYSVKNTRPNVGLHMKILQLKD